MAGSIRTQRGAGILCVLLLQIFLSSPSRLAAQASVTASQDAKLSVFAGPSAVLTQLNGGRNISITAGIDLSLRKRFGLYPSIEIRGTFPVLDGSVDSQRNLLAGVRLSHPISRVQPYVDVLFGRGRITYLTPLPDPSQTFLYLQSSSNILSGGAGLQLPLTAHFDLLADAQFQRYSTPVTVSGHLYPIVTTIAVVYKFDFNHHPRSPKH